MADAQRFTASLTGTVNDVDFEVTGEGTYDRGLSRGVYEVSKVPDGFDVLVLNAFLLLGDPSVHRPIGAAVNPFKGSYEYERTLEFRDGNRITATVSHDKSSGDTRSRFQLRGTSKVPPLDSVSSVVEHWSAGDADGMSTEIAIEWLTLDGEVFSGVITTRYKLPQGQTPRQHQHLWQRLISHASGSRLEIFQDSVLRVADGPHAGAVH